MALSSSSSHSLAGAISGLAACFAVQPLDVIKTRLQQPISLQSHTLQPTQRTLFSSVHVCRRIYQEHGWTGYWRGTAATLVRNVPGTSLYFLLLEYCRSSLFYAMPSASPYLIHMSSGAFSRGCVGLLLMPVSVIKTRFESSLYQYPSVWGAFRDILAKEGFKGLFVGFGVTSLRDIPFAGIYLMCYEYSKKRFMEPSMPAWLNKSASAIVAGTIATIITQPFDLIKTKIQIAPSKYPNFLIVFKSLAQLESIKVFFTGLGPRLVRKPLHAAITWTVYEESLRIFKKV